MSLFVSSETCTGALNDRSLPQDRWGETCSVLHHVCTLLQATKALINRTTAGFSLQLLTQHCGRPQGPSSLPAMNTKSYYLGVFFFFFPTMPIGAISC